MGSDTTPDSNEPEGRSLAPVWFLLLVLAIVVGGVLWVLFNSFKSGTV